MSGQPAVLKDGTILVISSGKCFVSVDNAASWSERGVVYSGAGPGEIDYGLVIETADGNLVVAYMDFSTQKWDWDPNAKELSKDSRLDIWSARSMDCGETWMDRQPIYKGYCGALLDIAITTSGKVVVPVQGIIREPSRHAIFSRVSEDNGMTWQTGNIIDLGGRGHHAGGFEPTLTELSDGRLWMLIRTNLDQFWSAFSNDGGRFWRRLEPSDIDASSSPGFLHRLASGRHLLLWNRLYPEGQQNYPRRSEQHSELEASWH